MISERIMLRLLLPNAFWRHAPGWLQRWREGQINKQLRETLLPGLLDAMQGDGAGTVTAWADPGTPAQEILAWFDDELASAPRAAPLDWFQVQVLPFTAAEWRQLRSEGGTLPYDPAWCWQGSREDWWQAGREVVGEKVPPQHDGLYLSMISLGTGFDAVTDGQWRSLQDTRD